MAGTFGAGLLGMGGGAVIGGSIVRLFLDTSEFDAALLKVKGETESAAATGGAAAGKFSLLATAAYAAAAYAAVKFATASIRAAVDYEHAQVLLANAIKNSSAVAQDSAAAFNAQSLAIAQTTGVYQENVTAGQAMLISMHLTAEQITTLTPLVVDLASKLGDTSPSGVSVAAKAVGKAMEGSSASLSKYGIVLDKTAYAADHAGTVISALGAIQGIAAEQAKAEPWKLLGEQFHEVELSVGQALLPVLKALVPVLGDVLRIVVDLKVPLLGILAVFAGYKVLTLFHAGLVSIAGGLQAIGAATSTGLSGVGILGVIAALGSSIAEIASANPIAVAAGLSAIGDALAGPVRPDQAVILDHYAMALERIQTTFPAFASAGPGFNQFFSDLQFAIGQVKTTMAAGMSGSTLTESILGSGEVADLNKQLAKTGSSAKLTAQDLVALAKGGTEGARVAGILAAALRPVAIQAAEAGLSVHQFAALGGQSLHAFRQTTLTSLKQSEQSFSTFSVGWKHTAGNLLNEMDRMKEGAKIVARDLAEITPNLAQTANGRSFLAFLQTQGPSAIDKYAGYSKAKQQQILGDWKSTDASIQQQTNTLASGIGKAIGAIPDKTVKVSIDVIPNVASLSTVIDQRIAAAIAGLKTGGP